MAHSVAVLNTENVTHNVVRLTVEKPDGYDYTPGQATDVALDRDGWRDEQRPFTFTSLTDADHLEFTIKVYPDHDGVTEQIGKLQKGDRLLIDEPWGAIQYKGPGAFIAGGAGVTPFIAILRDLERKGELEGQRLIFSNSTERDIILRGEFEGMKGLECLFTVTDQNDSPLARGMIDQDFLKAHLNDFGQEFYVCGPPKMIDSVTDDLKALGADPDSVTLEE
ncbi:FAD-binding oxidoreductase [Thalassobaculum sp. OXR-137]|uniref:FAD-binding oxidoreductase n=1 Tax=Thalassobaculum sp. OXR-137 TaxID=3100173 RepID=UPI002AC95E82|nr:FAD-binding oxidoreductase [Thalassobaculum sp. OXR-137]WPZ35921.1 FAD-binding oxidoreductase [Thalassobaculum sp. OXR-137]